MRTVKLQWPLVLIWAMALIGCAATPALTRDQIHEQHPVISRLDQAVQDAQARRVDLLAPQGLGNAVTQLAESYRAAEKGQAEPAEKAAALGMSALERAQANAKVSADVLAEVLDARDKAVQAGARDTFRDELTELDENLKSTSQLIENGDQEKAKQQRPQLRQAYSALELKALKEGTVQRARGAIERAREHDAHKLAPKTFKSAQDSLAVAVSELDTDRTARGRAEAAAQRALIQAERSEHLAEVVKDFDRRDFQYEDIALWHQDQLAAVSAPLNKALLFNEPHKQTVVSIRDEIAVLAAEKERLAKADAALKQAESTSAQTRQQHEQESAALRARYDQELAAAKAQHAQELAALKSQHGQEIAQLRQGFSGREAELTAAQREREQRFVQIQRTFDQSEANVYRQGSNVLINVHGFKFPAGSSEIQPQNFALMNKLVQSIGSFPGAKVHVAGHTDATGGDQINMSLSKQRADSVAKFLHEVGGIPQNRISAEGFGSQRPVASNATPEGRALNRRIDVTIINEP